MAPRIKFDFSSIDPRTRIILIGGVLIIVLAVVGLVSYLGNRDGGPTSAVATLDTTATLPPTNSPAPPSAPSETSTIGPTATIEPYTYQVEPGDTLFFIIQLFGYRDTAVVPEVLAMNGMANENDLIAGETLLIPRQTPTVGPTFTASSTLDPLITPPTGTATGTPGPTIDPNITVTYSDCNREHRCTSPDGQFWIHIVQSGDTIAGIAFAYETKVDCILRENGLPQNPIIYEGQQIKVCILVTQTPTLTPTGGPGSTATPIPTPSAPSLIAPAQNAEVPRNQNVTLQWVDARPLDDGEYYLIVLQNVTTGEETRETTRSNSYRLPDSLKPGVGRSFQFEWRVVIVAGSDIESPLISGPGVTYTFKWG